MTSQEAKQHLKKAQENPDEYHFEWFFDNDGEEITPEPTPEPEISKMKALWIRVKFAFLSTLHL